MSAIKQIVLCLALVAVAAAGWFTYRNPSVLSFAREASEAAPAERSAARGERSGSRVPGLPGSGGAINVITGAVEIENGGDPVSAIGSAKAIRSATLFPQVSGVVEKVLFTPGEAVAAGDVLVQLENAEQSVAVERARIALSDAEAALERARRLAASKTTSAVALSEAESAAQIAGIELKTAEINLARRAITAPFAGMTGLTDISVGDVVATTTEIVTLDNDAQIRVSFELPERRADQVRKGQKVTGTSEAQPGVELAGEIVAVGSRVDAETRTLTAEAEFANPQGALKSGMAVTIAMTFENAEAMAVPSLAVQWDRQGSFVWKVADGAAQRTEIAIISRLSGSVVVTGEVRPGDRVVVEGVQRLREGSEVVEVGAGPAEAAPAAPSQPAAPAVSQNTPGKARS